MRQAVFVAGFHRSDVRTTREREGTAICLFWKQQLLISRNRSGGKLKAYPFMAKQKTILITNCQEAEWRHSAKSSL